jgi:hypothetical protein
LRNFFRFEIRGLKVASPGEPVGQAFESAAVAHPIRVFTPLSKSAMADATPPLSLGRVFKR